MIRILTDRLVEKRVHEELEKEWERENNNQRFREIEKRLWTIEENIDKIYRYIGESNKEDPDAVKTIKV